MEADVSMGTADRDADGIGPRNPDPPNQASEKQASGEQASEGQSRQQRRKPDKEDLDQLARDWITVWQSEISAMTTDADLRGSWRTMIGMWAGMMSGLVGGLPRPSHERADRTSRPADAPRAAAPASAPEPRDAEIERLSQHVAGLERRLAELERSHSPIDPERRPKRKPAK